MASQTKTKSNGPDAHALTSRVARKTRYVVADNAKRAPLGDGSYVTRGVVATGALAGEETLILQDGSSQTGLPLAAVTVAIMGDVLTRAEIAALHAAADKS